MIDLVIDRTETDVLLGNSKGIYQAEDLNRVRQAVEELAALLPQLDLQTAVAPKTDWAPPEAYDPDKWIRTANMAVYLENVTTSLSTMGILAPADFPWTELLDLPWGERHRESAPASARPHLRYSKRLSIQRRSIRRRGDRIMTDRVPGAPGRYTATITASDLQKLQAGEAFNITLTRNDAPITEGTPYSKAAVLPDALASVLCPDVTDPSPADAFSALLALLNAIGADGSSAIGIEHGGTGKATAAEARSALGAEPAFTKNNAFNKNFGSAAGTPCAGNDGRLSNARRASNISMSLSGTTLTINYS